MTVTVLSYAGQCLSPLIYVHCNLLYKTSINIWELEHGIVTITFFLWKVRCHIFCLGESDKLSQIWQILDQSLQRRMLSHGSSQPCWSRICAKPSNILSFRGEIWGGRNCVAKRGLISIKSYSSWSPSSIYFHFGFLFVKIQVQKTKQGDQLESCPDCNMEWKRLRQLCCSLKQSRLRRQNAKSFLP